LEHSLDILEIQLLVWQVLTQYLFIKFNIIHNYVFPVLNINSMKPLALHCQRIYLMVIYDSNFSWLQWNFSKPNPLKSGPPWIPANF
jgi:hypothetical protein